MQIIKGKQAAPRRVLIYGQHGVGKDTWASFAPNPIYLDLEDGLNNLDVNKSPLIKDISQFHDYLMWVYQAEHDFRTVVISTLDWLERLIHEYEVKQIGDSKIKSLADVGYGKGYPRATPHWKRILSLLDCIRRERRMAVILVAHAKVEKFQDPEVGGFDRYSLDLHKEASGYIQEWCDEVFFAKSRVSTIQEDAGFNQKTKRAVGGSERLIITCECATAVAKNRLNLPKEIPMDWNFYMNAIVQSLQGVKPQQEPQPEPQPEPAPQSGNMGGLIVDGSSKPQLSESEQDTLAQAAGVF